MPRNSDERVYGIAEAAGGSVVVGVIGLPGILLLGVRPGVVIGTATLAIIVFMITRMVIAVGPSGVRRVWPSRLNVGWSEIAGVRLVRDKGSFNFGRVRPIVVLTEGRSISVLCASRPDGVAGDIKAAIEDGMQRHHESSVSQRP